ncbi:MAG TPA: hypothetical protein VF601_10760 [Beijerinckiaceae bacterium]
MDLSSPQAVAAVVAAITALVTAMLTGLITFFVAERKLRRDFGVEFAAEKLAYDLMMTEWRLRSFDLIKLHLGGFEDDALRKLLVRAGAIRFRSKSGYELWGLLQRTRDLLGIDPVPWDPENRPAHWGVKNPFE